MGWQPIGVNIQSGFRAFMYDDDAMRPEIVTKYFGWNGTSIEIEDIAAALGNNRKFEFLLFDACFMATVETYYELRNTAKYIIASPAEVLGAGFPYEDIVPLFFDKDFSSEAVCRAFMDFYALPAHQVYGNPSSVVSYAVTSEMDDLAAVVRQINASVPEIASVAEIQAYEKYLHHIYYDLEDYIDKRVSAASPSLYQVFGAQFDKAFPPEGRGCTPSLYGNVPSSGFFTVNASCGVSTYIRNTSLPQSNAAYASTSWAVAVAP